jgi:urea transport system ATP-binding protein
MPNSQSQNQGTLPVGVVPADQHPRLAEGSILYLDGITVSFDGFKALNNLSLIISPNEMRTIIGPNGAGKTTMMDVITGKTRPDQGTALYEGLYDLTQLDEAEIANKGIGRKFQKPTVFEELSVYENLELALVGPRKTFAVLWAHLSGAQRDRIDEILATIRLNDRRLARAGSLSHGQKQWLEIGMLLAQEPRLMMLDEPVAGMTDAETEQTAELLVEIAKGRSVLVVEHDMEFVRALNTKVTVLHEGSVVAEGSLDRVLANERVIEVYLGR